MPRTWSPFVSMLAVGAAWALGMAWLAGQGWVALQLTLPVVVCCLLASAAPGPRGGGVLRPLCVALALGLMYVCGWRAYGDAFVSATPWWGLLWVVVLATATASTEHAPRRNAILIAVGAGLGVLTLAPTLGLLEGVAASLNPVRPVPLYAGRTLHAEGERPDATGRREGLPTRREADRGATCATPPRFVTAERAQIPWEAPLTLALGWPEGATGALDRGTVDTALDPAACHLLDVLPYDALLLGPEPALEAGRDMRARRRLAEAIARYVRGGGCLIGPGLAEPWPAGLADTLRLAPAVVAEGAEGLQPLGLGRIGRAASLEQALEMVAADAWIPSVRARVDRGRDPLPALPYAGDSGPPEPGAPPRVPLPQTQATGCSGAC